MIFVILGTQDKKFPRLLDALQKKIDEGKISKKEEIIVQAGSTKYESKNMKIIDYMSVRKFEECIDRADLIICHAGVGTILTALKKGKKIIAAARLKQYGEHVNDHQLQILDNFTAEGYILALEDFDKIDLLIKQAKHFTPAKFKSNKRYFLRQLEKEINNQRNKLERIKKAYINGVFELKEYNEEKKIVEKAIAELEAKLDTTDSVEELRFTPKDILLKRDIDFINKIKLDEEYQVRTRTWKDYTREEQAELIMKYVDDIELSLVGTEIVVNQINFRESICKPCQELFGKGYIDTIKPAIFGNVVGNIRFSNYLSEEEFGEVIMRLRQYYDVGYTEATYYLDKQMFYFNFVEDNSAIVRVFPLKDYYKLDPDCKMKTYEFGIIYIREEDKFQMQEIDTAFDYIPDETNTSVIYSKDTTPISVGVKPVKFCEDDAEGKN